MTYTLLTVPNPKLRIKADLVDDFGPETSSLVDGAIELMYRENGAGLAAPQFGIHKTFFVMDISDKETREGEHLQVFINPQITYMSDEMVTLTEGCLSLPGVSAEVTRPEKIRVQYLDRDFKEHENDFCHWQARCILHEYDHLVGKLYIDHLSPLKRKMLLNKSIRYQREQEKESQSE
ncbi:MAG: peptide deformylase [Alphaproteobacteria bacterium]|nr:MAG: peptide deformylase [Alphaproteobacteria bacterium]